MDTVVHTVAVECGFRRRGLMRAGNPVAGADVTDVGGGGDGRRQSRRYGTLRRSTTQYSVVCTVL